MFLVTLQPNLMELSFYSSKRRAVGLLLCRGMLSSVIPDERLQTFRVPSQAFRTTAIAQLRAEDMRLAKAKTQSQRT